MRVVLSQLVALRRKTGVGHYAEQLLRAMRRQAAPDSVEPYPNGLVRRLCRGAARARGDIGASASGQSGLAGKLGIEARAGLRRASLALLGIHFRNVCSRGHFDLYHEPNYLPLPADCPTVATLHDLSVLLHPHWHPAERVRRFERDFPRTIARCAHLLTVSEFVRQEVLRTLGVPAERVTAVPNGIRPGLRPLPPAEVAESLRRLGLPPRYLLSLGTIEPRKNVLMLLHAYCALPGPVRQRWPLLLVGSWGWGTAAVSTYWHDHARHRGVLHTGYTPEGHLATIYNGARALAYPSLYEGFGLPPLEMLACGGAVLASTAGAVAETAGQQAHLTPPDDVDGWRSALLRVTTDDDWWRSLRRGALAVARPYTWERCAAGTLAVYRSLTGQPAVSSGARALRAAG